MRADEHEPQRQPLDHQVLDHFLLAEPGDLLTPAQVLVQHVVVGEGLVHQDVGEGVFGVREVFLRGVHAVKACPHVHPRREACPGLLAWLRLGPRIHNLPDSLLRLLLHRDILVLRLIFRWCQNSSF